MMINSKLNWVIVFFVKTNRTSWIHLYCIWIAYIHLVCHHSYKEILTRNLNMFSNIVFWSIHSSFFLSIELFQILRSCNCKLSTEPKKIEIWINTETWKTVWEAWWFSWDQGWTWFCSVNNPRGQSSVWTIVSIRYSDQKSVYQHHCSHWIDFKMRSEPPASDWKLMNTV